MAELDARNRPFAAEEIDDRFQRLDLIVPPEPEVAMGVPSVCLDRGRLDIDQTGTAQCEPAEMDEMSVVRVPVLRPILAHGRDGDAVLEGDVAKRDRREKTGHRAGSRLDGWMIIKHARRA